MWLWCTKTSAKGSQNLHILSQHEILYIYIYILILPIFKSNQLPEEGGKMDREWMDLADWWVARQAFCYSWNQNQSRQRNSSYTLAFSTIMREVSTYDEKYRKVLKKMTSAKRNCANVIGRKLLYPFWMDGYPTNTHLTAPGPIFSFLRTRLNNAHTAKHFMKSNENKNWRVSFR